MLDTAITELTNLGIESNLLSLLINSNDNAYQTEITLKTNEKIFGHPRNRNLFLVIKDLVNNNKTLDVSLIIAGLSKFNDAAFKSNDDIQVFVITIKNRGVKKEDVNYNDYLETLYDLYQRRTIKQNLASLNSKITDRSISTDDLLQEYRDITMLSNKMDFVISSGNITDRRMLELNERRDLGGGPMTGYNNLDTMLSSCFMPGGISVIAGRPSMGKSLFKENLIYNLGISGAGVINFCLEQNFGGEMDRLTSIMVGIPLREMIQVWKWDEDDKRIEDVIKVSDSMDEKWNMHFIDKRTMTTTEAVNIIAYLNRSRKIDVVFFDLFDRFSDINDPMNKAENVTRRLSHLAEWARILKVHFCLIVQLSRKVDERRGDHRPTLQDLKSSGAYEEMSNLVFFIYRHVFYDKTDIDCPFEVIIGKQKDGKTGTAEFYMDEATLKLTEIGYEITPTDL